VGNRSAPTANTTDLSVPDLTAFTVFIKGSVNVQPEVWAFYGHVNCSLFPSSVTRSEGGPMLPWYGVPAQMGG